jgi:predicted deacylase
MRARRRTALVLGAALLASVVPAGVAADEAPAPAPTSVRFGTSAAGRPLVALHRSTPPTTRSGATRRVLVIGNLHGDEKAGLRVVERLRTARLPAGVDLWLVPSLNPDGTARGTRTNARGVDLNRNFPHAWARAGRGTAKYSGPRAASEPETRALMAFVRRHPPRTTVVLHQPLFGVDSYRAKSMALVRDLSAATGLPVKSFACRGTCHGTFTGWHNATVRGRAVTVELGRTVSARRLDRVAAAILRVGATG